LKTQSLIRASVAKKYIPPPWPTISVFGSLGSMKVNGALLKLRTDLLMFRFREPSEYTPPPYPAIL